MDAFAHHAGNLKDKERDSGQRTGVVNGVVTERP